MEYQHSVEDSSCDSKPSLSSSYITRTFGRLLRQPKPLPTLFYELTNRLTKFFSISRSTLIVRDPATGRLDLVAIWDEYLLREGLILELSQRRSLLYQMAEAGADSYVANTECFPGNRVEKTLLYNTRCRSLIICPAHSTNDVPEIEGFITFASPVPDAFELIASGYCDSIFTALGETLYLKRLNRGWEPTTKKRLAI